MAVGSASSSDQATPTLLACASAEENANLCVNVCTGEAQPLYRARTSEIQTPLRGVRHRLADGAAAMLAWENSGFSIDASVRITLFRPHLRVSCQPLEHLLRYCARPPFALERLSVIRDEDGRATKVRYVMPRHKAANWVGPGRGRKSTPPRKHRHRYHGVFAPNHPLRPGVTALAVGNVGKQRDAATGGHASDDHATGGCGDPNQKPHSHDTSRIAWAKLMARVGEKFPLECPACGGDIRLRGDCRQEPAHFEVRGSQAEEGQDGFARVKSATDTSRRTARTAADLSRSRAAHRLGRARAGARRPRRLSVD